MLDQSIDDHIPSNCKYYDIDNFNNVVKDTGFSLFHLNSRSLIHNIDTISDYLSTLNNNFSVLGFSETWFGPHNKITGMSNYNLFEQHRENRRGGGVCLFVHNKFPAVIRHDLSIFNADIESIFVELNFESITILVSVIYRPPQSSVNSFYDTLDLILSKISNEHKNCYIMGDFNIDLTKDKSSDFHNILSSYGYCPLISIPTRVTCNSASLIDNILSNTNFDDYVSGVLVTDISDHFPIFHQVNVCTNRVKNKAIIYIRNYSKCNVDKFVSKVGAVDWSFILALKDANAAYDSFVNTIDHIYDNCFPHITINTKKNRKRHPWITSGILKSIKVKNKLYRRFLRNPSSENNTNYKKYRNKLNHVIRFSKKNYFNDKFNNCKNNAKGTWSIINELLNKRSSNSVSSFSDGDNPVTDPKTIANSFNDFFVNIGPTLASNINGNKSFDEYLEPNKSILSSLFLNPVTINEVFKVAYSCLKSNKSAGSDNLKPGIIRLVIHHIVQPLTHISNLSFITGIFPNRLKIAKVVPIYKKDDPHVYENYRPISILPCISKIIERLMFNRIIAFLDKHNILFDDQYGFRPGHSTELALISAINKLYKALEQKDSAVGIFLDLSKAFDTIDHHILLYKLSFYGIRGNALDWFYSYLSNRYQYVYYNNCSSDLSRVKCGVPQGSILGPLLFILYTNDISNVSSKSSLILFADDTNIFYHGSNAYELQDIICSDLLCYHDWFCANKLSLNAAKTNYIVFGTLSKNWNVTIKLNDKIVHKVTSTKFLGVTIDSNLSWSDHIHSICNKISRSVGILSKLKYYIPGNILRCLYQTLILPHLSYCCSVWSSATKTTLNKLIVLQKKAIRHITNAHYRESTSKLFLSLNLLKLPDLIQINLATIIYRATHNNLPFPLVNLFKTNNDFHPYNTRHSNNIHCPPCRTNLIRFNTCNRAIDSWNSIPFDIQTCNSLASFRKIIRQNCIKDY